MKKPHVILRRPIVTEKMLKLQETQRQYAFEVDAEATKIAVKEAVEKKFDVTVEGVRILNVKGKSKRMNTRRGLTRGRRPNWRKAIVTLREGDTIDLFGTR